MSHATESRPELLQRSGSPIEDLMTMALFALAVTHMDDGFMFWPQVRIGKYRADFVVGYRGKSVVVECDGHEWHEKTKKQAARDKARDRFMLSQGYPVMRFTGSEIYADAFKCAEEVFAHVKGES